MELSERRQFVISMSRKQAEPRRPRKFDTDGTALPYTPVPQPGQTYLGRQTSEMACIPVLMLRWILTTLGVKSHEELDASAWEMFMIDHWRTINWIWEYWPRVGTHDATWWHEWPQAKQMALSWIWPVWSAQEPFELNAEGSVALTEPGHPRNLAEFVKVLNWFRSVHT